MARMQLPRRSWASHDGILYAVHFDAHDFASAALAATLIMHRLYRSKLQHTEYRIHLHRAWQPKHCAAHTVSIKPGFQPNVTYASCASALRCVRCVWLETSLYLVSDWAARYCDEHVCLSVCLSVWQWASESYVHASPNFLRICLPVHGRGASVFYWRRINAQSYHIGQQRLHVSNHPNSERKCAEIIINDTIIFSSS